eukprot:m.120328 g.120328  ORF g.120328 m.120328 type:complete len:110 (+) comp15492_c0_seq2:115-444(+)
MACGSGSRQLYVPDNYIVSVEILTGVCHVFFWYCFFLVIEVEHAVAKGRNFVLAYVSLHRTETGRQWELLTLVDPIRNARALSLLLFQEQQPASHEATATAALHPSVNE